jgi:integrase/recombinase XerD
MTDLIAQHIAHCRAVGMSSRTILDRQRLLRRLDRDLLLGLYEATTEELENWLAGPGPATAVEPWCRQTKATYYGHIVGFYRWAVDPGRPVGLLNDPSAGLIRPRVPEGRPRPVSVEQLIQARALLGQPWRLFVELAAFAGLRAVEISRLDREDVSKDEINVRRGKGDKPRVVETASDLWAVIQPLPGGPIARRANRLRMVPDEVARRTAQRLDEAGLPDVTLHRCRHFYATYLLDEGAEVTAVQHAMGHGSLKTTATYLMLTSRQRANLRRAVNALPALAPVPS